MAEEKEEQSVITLKFVPEDAWKHLHPQALEKIQLLFNYFNQELSDEIHLKALKFYLANKGRAPDDVKAKFAELFDLCVTIQPQDSPESYGLRISANMPLEVDGNTISAYDMVFSPPRGG